MKDIFPTFEALPPGIISIRYHQPSFHYKYFCQIRRVSVRVFILKDENYLHVARISGRLHFFVSELPF
jgi:hypothetical protein